MYQIDVFLARRFHTCRKLLQQLRTTCKVTMHLIKGHSSSLGNDIVNELVKMGSKKVIIVPESIILPFSLLKTEIKEITKIKHKKNSVMLTSCRLTKQALPELNLKLSRKLIKLPKVQIRNMFWMYGLLTGHCQINKHMHAI